MQPGQVFAERYEVQARIGEGGVGLVYRVRDLRSDNVVAIKCLRPEYALEPKIRRRFLREARAVNRLNHPNIVRMFTYGEDDEGVPDFDGVVQPDCSRQSQPHGVKDDDHAAGGGGPS